MATKKTPTTKKKMNASKKITPSTEAIKIHPLKAQLPSPITPILAIVAVIFTYIAFSLAIDSGSYWHYAAGIYFAYQTVRLTKISIKTRVDDKKRKTTEA